MDRAAARYNQLPPGEFVSGELLPVNTSIFLGCCSFNSVSTAIHKLSRNLMSWQTGDVRVDLERTRLEAFRALKAELADSGERML